MQIWKKASGWLFLVSLVLAIYVLRVYLVWTSVGTILGILACFLIGTQQSAYGWSKAYAVLALLATVMAILVPVKTVFYFATAMMVIYCWSVTSGPKSPLLLGVLLFMSPFFQYLVQVFSFPIRLQLTETAGDILRTFIHTIVVEGNVIITSNTRFSIDEVCMGLNMVVVSLLLGMVIWALSAEIHSPKSKRFQLPFWLYLAILLGLNIVMNLFRIVLIVLFESMPGTWHHEFIGVLSLVAYVILPLFWLVQFRAPESKAEPSNSYKSKWGVYLIPTFTIVAAFIVMARDKALQVQSPNSKVQAANAAYNVQLINRYTKKLTDEQSLIYIKQNPNWYQPDHNPQICWTGSGYELNEIQFKEVQGQRCYYGILKKGEERLYTIWWYENKIDRTLSQFHWRWNQFKGSAPYDLVNITVSAPSNLEAAFKKFEQYKNDDYESTH